jgi:hypothetical protein
VTPVKLYHQIERPSVLLSVACAPSAEWLSESAPVALLVAERAPVSQAHQVQVQAELVRTLVGVDASNNGTTGFVGGNSSIPMKRRTDGAGGAPPPRGRPV